MSTAERPNMISAEHHKEVSGISESRETRGERAEEIREMKKELEPVVVRIAQLSRTIEAAKKATFTDQELRARNEKVERVTQDEIGRGTDQEFAARIGQVAGQKFLEDVRAGQIDDSPQGRELERLKNRQYDLEARLQQLESETHS